MTNPQQPFKVGDRVRRKRDQWRVGTIIEICQKKGLALVLWKQRHSRVELRYLTLDTHDNRNSR